jgi:hypothetical protein
VYCSFTHHILCKVFIHNTIAGSEKGQYMFDEMTLIVIEFVVPINQIRFEINFLCGPEIGFTLFIKFQIS